MKIAGKVQKAFTLSEVLITLAIIGVIAAMTIPTILQQTQDEQLKVAWKQAYADLDQATKMVLMNNSGNIKGICNDSDNNCLKNLYQPYFNYTQSCNQNQSYGNCWNEEGKFWFLDGTSTAGYWGNAPGIVLSNGNLTQFWNISKSCNNSDSGILRCGVASIDVNGFKGPNKFGKDIFRVHILERGIKPYGTHEDTWKNKCAGSTSIYSGFSCAADFLYK